MLSGAGDRAVEGDVTERTAESFAYEWQHFGGLREEWEQNFLDYMRPHGPEFFEGLSVLDVGTGSGRHSQQAHRFGANVVAVDVGDSIDVARRNLPNQVLTIQADAGALPFEQGSFDFVMSIGVLHHLPDPGGTLASIARYAQPGGRVRVYLYWVPPHRWHRRLLGLVTAARRLTTRLPYRLLHAVCYPIAACAYGLFVLPYRLTRRIPSLRRLADALPLKTYADYPFAVCVNDQFDRFSAPIENRYTKQEVEAMMRAAGLVEVQVLPNHGWVAEGTRPAARR
jgi:SAM-dependent methyltransferase